MKAIKLAIVSILIAGTMVCLANVDGWGIKHKAVYNLTLIKAPTIPGLAVAIEWRLCFYPNWKVKSEIKPVYTTKQE